MARRRRRKQQTDPLQSLLGASLVGVFLFIYNATKSAMTAGIAAGALLGLIIGIILVIRFKREEKVKRSGIADIDKMDGRQFEHYLGHLFRAHGYSVNVTQAAGDFGADLVISKDGKKIVVQAKRYSKNVGIKAVQEAQASIAHYEHWKRGSYPTVITLNRHTHWLNRMGCG